MVKLNNQELVSGMIQEYDSVSSLFSPVEGPVLRRLKAEGLDIGTLNDEISVPLGGASSQIGAVVLHAMALVQHVTGTPNGDSKITIGVVSGGAELLAEETLDIGSNDESKILTLKAKQGAMYSDSSIYVKCTMADTGASSDCLVDFYFWVTVFSVNGPS